MSQNTTLNSVIDFLLSPIPLLPASSFILKRPALSASERRKRRMLAAQKAADLAKVRDNAKNQTPAFNKSTSIILSGRLCAGQNTAFSINGQDFAFDANTWVFGQVRLGSFATISASKIDGKIYARKIVANC